MNARGYKWVVLALLSGAFFFHQADRALFGLLTIPIQEDLGLTDLQIGWVNTALFCTLAVTTPFAGMLGDRVSRKWIITFSLLFWSLMTACTGFVGGICGLVFFRSVATGGGESFYAPSAFALLASHHRETRSIAFSVHQSALYVGLMFSGALVAWALHLLGGWRPVFFVFGGLGFLLGVVFCFALKERPADANAETAGTAGASVAAARPAAPSFAASLRAYFCNPSALLASVGFIAVVFANNAYLCWAPKFVARKFGLSVGAAGSGTMLYHHVAAFAAIMLGAFVTDRLVVRHPRFRLGLQIAALVGGAPALLFVGCAPGVAACWCAVVLYGVFRGLFEVNTHASLFDVVVPAHRASAEGLMTMIAFFIGSLSPLLLGALSDRYGVRGFEIGFGVLGAGYLVGVAALLASFLFTFRRDRVVE